MLTQARLATTPCAGQRVRVIDYDALRTEVLRVQRRYSEEVVEAFGFCPWARGARNADRVCVEVLFGEEPTHAETLAAIAALIRDDTTDVGLLVLPELALGRVAFQHFAARLRELTASPVDGPLSAFAIADFHPQVEPQLESPERLVAVIRKSPDPTLQIVRRSTLEAVRHGDRQGTRFVDVNRIGNLDAMQPQPEALHARIAQANFTTVQERGVAVLAGVLADILADRHRSYARLGLPVPHWAAGTVDQKQENLDPAE